MSDEQFAFDLLVFTPITLTLIWAIWRTLRDQEEETAPTTSPSVYPGDMLPTVKQNARTFEKISRHPIMSGMPYSVTEN